MSPKTKHIAALDGVRAFSILFVLASHMLPLGFPQWRLNHMSGLMGMSLFFCLSGFLITRILWDDQNIRHFLTKRFLRIIPAIWLYLAIVYALVGMPETAVLAHVLFVANYTAGAFAEGPVGHLWSLSVEAQFYLAVAIAVGLGGKRMLFLLPVAAVVVTLLRIDAGATSNIKTHLRVDEILSGGCLALIHIHWGSQLAKWFARPSRPLVLFLVVLPLWLMSSHQAWPAMNYLRPYFAMTLVGICMWGHLPVLTWVLKTALFRRIAEMSYAIYIYHPLTMVGILGTGTLVEKYLIKRPISFALTGIAAWLSTYYWERWWMQLARKRTSPPAAVKGADG